MMNKKIFFTTVAMLLVGVNLFAQQNHYNSYNNQRRNHNGNGNQIIGVDIPDGNRTKYPDRQRDRVELNTQYFSKEYKLSQKKYTQRQRVLSGTYDVELSMTPEYRVFKSIDSIAISPAYLTTLFLPKGYMITDAYASFPVNYFKYNQNVLALKPDDSQQQFFSGNIFLLMTNGKRNYSMNIYVEKYYQKRYNQPKVVEVIKNNDAIAKPLVSTENQNIDTNLSNKSKYDDEILYSSYHLDDSNNNIIKREEQRSEDYQDSENKLSTVFKYFIPKILSDEDTILLYERMTNSKMEQNDLENGDYVAFIYGGVTYRIIRNDTQGKIIYGEKAYIIENSLQKKW